MAESIDSRRSAVVLVFLAVLASVAAFAFLTIDLGPNWSYAVGLRTQKLAALVLVAYAIATSTVMFQTITENRILTPSILGFDAFYILIQTILAYGFGHLSISNTNPQILFLLQTGIMVGASVLISRWMLDGRKRDLQFVALAGLMFGILLRSVSNFLQRVIDPGEFAVLQDRMFASFNLVHADLLGISAVLIGLASLIGWRMRSDLDVLALGRETAINLGLNYSRSVRVALLLVSLLVSVSTALVGPVTFFGLLVAHLAYRIAGTHRHAFILPAAVFIASTTLIAGQL
ncbi:iron chelate uptake ABC transporter family permease subunit [Rhizobium lentis]|uniref:iron chelate uptake ABC transporter family permease subunit n=1 Tax=Rhizobium lentis TaxID=1138194 RepID=UPI001C82A17D|nr:iron chelate uptake ABC transporter family permease subunit [Rhizobium lentis]MBX5041279.1 iron chelate uptake ABC transporter family permease subunit [Rhizobium lentis]MBX5071536.1 iron chelate uptake ABC transporter family permease subunit [Rhizobium lentis]MBX5108426.1 iron chelate uptake ABC transporter family permease subunit [Rhizobium lentis]MBX5117338.1 iron chelate uptake ABC transporter family permease subunit [Rhizobium lentis]